jgi:hypothetical protein
MAYAAVFNPFRPAPAPTTAVSAALPAQKTDAPAAALPTGQATQTVAASLPQKKEQETAGAAEQRRNEAPAQKPPASKKGEPSKAEQAQSQRKPEAASKETKETAKKAAAGETTEGGGYVVNVLVQVNRGRVISARVIDSRPSAGAYEAAAVSKARQRQYPENFTGGERLRIVVRQ